MYLRFGKYLKTHPSAWLWSATRLYFLQFQSPKFNTSSWYISTNLSQNLVTTDQCKFEREDSLYFKIQKIWYQYLYLDLVIMMVINWPCINDPRVTFLLISISRIDLWQNISTNSRWYAFCILCRLKRISGWHSATWSKPFTPCCRGILFLQPKSEGKFFSSSFRWLDSAICKY